MARSDLSESAPVQPADSLKASLLGYFLVGAGWIVVVKLAVQGLTGTGIAAAIAILAIVLKCWAHWKERDRGASWAGDEVYYLGLLFTLTSLILAIIQLFVLGAGDLESGENLRDRTYELIGNFGIALVSTVAGILGRILLQGREADPPTSDSQAVLIREQLQAVRRNLFEAADGFAHFTRVTLEQAEGTRASAEGIVAGFNKRLVKLAQVEIRETAANWRQALAAMRTEHEAVVGDGKRELLSLRKRWTEVGKQAQTELERVTQRFDAAATEALQRTEAGWSQLAISLAGAAETMRDNQGAHGAELNALLEDLRGLRQGLQPFGVALASASDAVAAFRNGAQGSAVGIGDAVGVLQETQKTMQMLNDTAKRVDANLGLQVSDMEKTHRALTNEFKDLIAGVNELSRNGLASLAGQAREAAAVVEKAAGQAGSLGAKIENLDETLDKQRNAVERNIEQFERLLEKMNQADTTPWWKRNRGGG